MPATTVVAISGPMPGMFLRRRHLASFSLISSISLAIVSIRIARNSICTWPFIG
jgi:hypothetical protein